MPIWDRPYMHDPRPQVPFRVRMRTWSITKWLIVINVVAFLVQLMSHGTPVGRFVMDWLYNHPEGVLTRGYIWQPMTSAFLHEGVWHILWNMLFLWWFGGELERIYGRTDFLAFYLLACYVGGLAYALGAYFYTGAASVSVGQAEIVTGFIPSLGASSGVMGVVILYAFFYPHHRMWVYFIFPVKIWILAVVFVLADLTGFLGGSRGGVANAAHLGGALVAVLYRYTDMRWSVLTGRLRRLTGWIPRRRARPDRRSFRVHPRVGPVIDVVTGPDRPRDVSRDDRQRMDELLRRIHDDGVDSLTDDEKAFLADMSRRLRHRP